MTREQCKTDARELLTDPQTLVTIKQALALAQLRLGDPDFNPVICPRMSFGIWILKDLFLETKPV